MSRMSRRTFVEAGVAAAGSLALGGPALGQQKLREVSIALSSASLGPAAPRIAQELGLFANHGLTAKTIVMDATNTALAALIAKSVDAAMAGPGAIITAQARGQRFVMIANGYAGIATTMPIAKSVAEKLGVSPTAPPAERLKATEGLLIGTPDATAAATIAFKGAAAKVGVNMRFTYMAQQTMPAALQNGSIQGFLASAPFWAIPVVNGTGIVWISGPKGELPPENTNTSSTGLQMLRETAEADPQLAKSFAAVFADLRKAIVERPADVKAAVSRVFPDLDAKMLEVLYASESNAWNARPLTAADMAREIEFVKAGGVPIPGIENVDPASLLFDASAL